MKIRGRKSELVVVLFCGLLLLSIEMAAAQDTLQKPFEKRKDDYIVQTENMMATFNRNLAKLTRTAAADPMSRSAFEAARRDYLEKYDVLRSKLAKVAPLPPQQARQFKSEIDSAAGALKASYNRVLATVP